MNLIIINRTRSRGLRLNKIGGLLKKLSISGLKRAKNINIVFTNDSEIKTLNKKFLKKNRTTDVISFNLDDDMDDTFGEIVISVETARRQAVENGHSLFEELKLLALHGLLHLAGERDYTATEIKRMRRLEKKYLSRVARDT